MAADSTNHGFDPWLVESTDAEANRKGLGHPYIFVSAGGRPQIPRNDYITSNDMLLNP